MVSLERLYDSNILIDHLNGVALATHEIQRHSRRGISIITWMEVLAGATASTESGIRSLLGLFRVVEISPEIAERAASIRRSTRLKLPDAIILATAEIDKRTLITRNTRDFDPNHPSVHVPYKI